MHKMRCVGNNIEQVDGPYVNISKSKRIFLHIAEI